MAKSACFLEEVNLFVNALKKKKYIAFQFFFFCLCGVFVFFLERANKKKSIEKKIQAHSVS